MRNAVSIGVARIGDAARLLRGGTQWLLSRFVIFRRPHIGLLKHELKHGRSTEAEIREIIDSAVRPTSRIRLGTALAELGRKYGGLELQIERDQSPAAPVRL